MINPGLLSSGDILAPPDEFRGYQEVINLFNLSVLDGIKVGRDLISPDNSSRVFVLDGPMSELEAALLDHEPLIGPYLMDRISINSSQRVYRVPLNAQKLDIISGINEDLLFSRNSIITSKIGEFFNFLKDYPKIYGLVTSSRLALYQKESDLASEECDLLIIPS